MTKREEKNSKSFDPFNDRLARDIRNGLSTAFAQAVEDSDASSLEKLASGWLEGDIPGSFAAYITDRLLRYRRVLQKINPQYADDPRVQALLAWNEKLYFEVHELLEAVWHPATGERRKALQGLILAAGIGEHMQYDHMSAAKRLAVRADKLIREHRHHLEFIENLEDLLNWLKNWESAPPKLHAIGNI